MSSIKRAISIGNHMISSAICMCNQMVPSEIIPLFHEFTIWLPINIMGDELR